MFFGDKVFEKDGKYYQEIDGKTYEVPRHDPSLIDCVPESWIENYPEHPCSP